MQCSTIARVGAVAAGLLAIAGCSVQLDVPSSVQVACASNADCPQGVCAVSAGYCVAAASLDAPPPELLTPADQSVVLGNDKAVYALAWTARPEARAYVVQVATDAAFTNIVVETTSNAPVAEVTLTSAVTYWWRARTDMDAGFEPGHPQARFDLIDSTFIAAGCATDPLPPSDPGWTARVGNLSKPFCDIGGAISAAAVYGIPEVRIAGFGDDRPYTKTVNLVAGVSLSGGWSADFSQRDVSAHPTVIEGGALTVLVASGVRDKPTVVEGLIIRQRQNSQAQTFVVQLTGCDDALVLRNNTIVAVDSESDTFPSVPPISAYSAQLTSVAIDITDSSRDRAVGSGPQLIGNTIIAGTAAGFGDVLSAAVQIHWSEPVLVGNVIHAGPVMSSDTDAGRCGSFAVTLDDSSAVLAGNSIASSFVTESFGGLPTCTAQSESAAISAWQSSPYVVGNVITSGPAQSSFGYRGDRDGGYPGSTAQFVGNTILLAAGVDTTAAIVVDSGHIIVDNILAALGSSADTHSALLENNPGTLLHRFDNNAIAGFATAYTTMTGGGALQPWTLSQAEAQIGVSGLASNNMDAFASAYAVGFVAIDAGDIAASNLALGASADAFLLRGGASYTAEDCNVASPRAWCAVFGQDHAKAARTCPNPGTDCWSVGAFESD